MIGAPVAWVLSAIIMLPLSTAAAAAADIASSDTVRSVIPPITEQTSLLVVSPHPDDETLCCAGFIQRVLRAGGLVSIVWITSGDASELDLLLIEKRLVIDPRKLRELGLRRMREARDAAVVLGVPPDHQYFLGYPDRGLSPILTEHASSAYRSKFTDTAVVPYAGAVYPGHPYTGQSLEQDFAAVLDRVRPNIVLAPSVQDTHPDHSATGVLTMRTLARQHGLALARYWIVHGGSGWPAPRGLEPQLPLRAAPRAAGLLPVAFQLEPDEEEHKLAALRAYHTQMAIMSSILLSFVRTNELFSVLSAPPKTSH